MADRRTSEQHSKHLYHSLRKGNIAEVVQAYEDATTLAARLKLIPTVNDDTILHMAIYMGQIDIAMEIIERSFKHKDKLITQGNAFGSTALHEAAATDCVDVVKKLLEKEPALLTTVNKQGEMPLYKAALFGQRQIFILLAEKLEQENVPDLLPHLCSLYSPDDPNAGNTKFSRDPRDIYTVLHAAIHGEFFELALLIARKYGHVVPPRNKNSKTPLQLLSSNPSAFKSGMKCGLIKRFIYYWAPYENAKEEEEVTREQDSSDDRHVQSSNRSTTSGGRVLFSTDTYRNVLTQINRSIWIVLRAWRPMGNIYDEKKKHGRALELAKFLIAKDFSWDIIQQTDANEDESSQSETPDIPLFIATSNGILEIVKETLRVHPLSLGYTNKENQNILHLAIMHRQSDIFDDLAKRVTKRLTSRLARQIDKNGFTILHHVGNMEFYRGGTQPGPALQLREELKWYEDVKDLVPRYYAMKRNKRNEKETIVEFYGRKYVETVKELSQNVDKIIPPKSVGWDESKEETSLEYFGQTHQELLEEAQEWLKRTSGSCSLVAALIASVAFAAAFTIPGGNNHRNGQPILIDSPFFLFFIITDALSISSSLTSLAMFLSILTSPYELDDFRNSLPRKLIFGFTLLFISVAVTMLAFSSTMMLTIPIKKLLTTTLIYCIAFLPVTMFALLQFPLYVAFKRSLQSSFKVVRRILPWPLETVCSMATDKSHTS